MQQTALLNTEATPVTTKPYHGSVIYETVGRAREYRELACNLYTGCDHGCTYCYAPNALQRQRSVFHSQVQPRKDILSKLAKDATGYGKVGERRQVLFCFATDPYCHADTEHALTRQSIRICHQHGLSVCTLTKGGTRSLRDLDLFGAGDSYACTLTSLDPDISRRWEPNAALPEDRIEALSAFHAAGVHTWVSLEPVLNADTTLEIIRQTSPHVDEFKVGKLNYRQEAKAIDWARFARDAIALLDRLGKRYYIKQDLRAYLD
jgi:DNA repair photolyase